MWWINYRQNGASCDCNYFNGMLDDASISGYDIQDEDCMLYLRNSMKEGNLTYDQDLRTGTIHGAHWVMPDGSLVGQAIRLENDESYVPIQITIQMSLFCWLPNTAHLQVSALVNFVEVCSIWPLRDHDSVPSWSHEHRLTSGWGITFGTLNGRPKVFGGSSSSLKWTSLILQSMSVVAAPEPPPLSEMTELFDGISVPGVGGSDDD